MYEVTSMKCVWAGGGGRDVLTSVTLEMSGIYKTKKITKYR